MKILGVDPGFERLGVAILEKNPLGILVGTNMYEIDKEGYITYEKGNIHINNHTFKQYEYIQSFFSSGLQLFCPTILVRKSFFIENNLYYNFKVGPAADNYLWFESNLYPVELELISEPLFLHRSHLNQDSKENSYTMDISLFQNTIKLLMNNLHKSISKPLIKLIISKLTFTLAIAFRAGKLTKSDLEILVLDSKKIIKKINIGAISINNLLLNLVITNSFIIILMHKINVYLKKL